MQRVLVAIDLAPGGEQLTAGSRLAVDHALALAPTLGISVLLFHSTASDEAWDPGEQAYTLLPGVPPEERRTVFEGTLERFRLVGAPVELELSDESAWLAIIQRVLRDRIDLVISGKRNEPDRGGQRLGSVSTKLLRKCPCAVWVARPGSDPVPKTILAAVDLSAVGQRVLASAAFIAEQYQSELHVVHAMQLPLAIQMEGQQAIANFARVQRNERIQEFDRAIAATGCKQEVSHHVAITSPTQAILACAERFRPDLAVMGTVSRGGVAGLLVGNTAERLLPRLDCSLLTVKPEDFVSPVEPAD